MKGFGRTLVPVIFLCGSAAACSSGGKSSASAPPRTPTPSVAQRLNPNIIEETATYYIERLSKKDPQIIRVDDKHIRLAIMRYPVEFFKEDDDYYYVYVAKNLPEEEAARKQQKAAAEAEKAQEPPSDKRADPSLFTNIFPARTAARFRLEEVADTGLPQNGMWRHSFAVADMNGDGIPDIVAPPARMTGDPTLHIWLGDGAGHFKPWKLTFFEDGKPKPNFSLDYGGVAVGDVDGDGKLDVIAASQSFGLTALFGDGTGRFEVSRRGLRAQAFSTQAVALVDVDGDGKPDLVVSRDTYEGTNIPWNHDQVQVYLNKGNRTFELDKAALVDAPYSNSVVRWDLDGRTGVLLGSNAFSAIYGLYRADGKGRLVPDFLPDYETYAYHFANVPGTFGKDRTPAFADLFFKGNSALPNGRASGINVYEYASGKWVLHRVWREQMGKSVLVTIAFGDLDGDGLDDIVFPDSDRKRLRIFLQQPDGTFREAAEEDEPPIGLVPQHVKLVDLNGDGRLDVVLSKTISSEIGPGGWSVFLNRPKPKQ